MKNIMFLLLLVVAACHPQPDPRAYAGATDTGGTADKLPPAPSADWLIIPGVSVGHIRLQEITDSVFKMLGNPDAGDAAMGKSLSVWYAHHDPSAHQTAVFAARQMGVGDEASRIKQIRVTSPSFRTREGIGPAASLEKIKTIYRLRPAGSFKEKGTIYFIYDTDEGIGFEADSAGVCRAIIVHDKADTAESTYLPFH